MGTPHHDTIQQALDALIKMESPEFPRSLELLPSSKGLQDGLPRLAVDQHEFFENLVGTLINHGIQNNRSPFAVCGRSGRINQLVTAAFRGLQRSCYAPLLPHEPMIALLDVPGPELSCEQTLPRISATPIGWVCPPNVEPQESLITFVHIHGKRLWYEFPPNDINRDVLAQYPVEQRIAHLPVILSQLMSVDWRIVWEPTTFRVLYRSFGFFSLEACFHVIV